MSKAYSPSDYKGTSVNYSNAVGYYRSGVDVCSLLQLPFSAFTSGTSPSMGDVGKILQRVEDYVDEKMGYSHRPNIYSNEYHNFEYRRSYNAGVSWFVDYVAFIQLDYPKVRKILALEVWQGDNWKTIGGTVGKITINDNFNNINWIKLGTPDGDYFQLEGSNVFGAGLAADDFNKKLGKSTTAKEICHLINEQYPTETADFTCQDEAKVCVSNAGNKNISDYFYAIIDSEDSSIINVYSLLPGRDGNSCTLTQNSTGDDGCSVGTFGTDSEGSGRENDWWKIGNEGKLFFRQDYPFLSNNSVRVTYIVGSKRVPAYINEVATKLVAAELLRHDDATIMIAESGAQIDIKGKYDELRKDADAILMSKRKMSFLISD